MVICNKRLYFSLVSRTIIDYLVLAAEKFTYLTEKILRSKGHEFIIAESDLVKELRTIEHISLKRTEAARLVEFSICT